jgi:hypothetical protein
MEGVDDFPIDLLLHYYGYMKGKLIMVHRLNCRGEVGKWIALIVVVLRLFYPRHFPGMISQYVASLIMLYNIVALDVHCISPFCNGSISGAHIKFVSFMSHPTITRLFSFQPIHASLRAYLVHITCERVEMKKDKLSLDERLKAQI